MLISLTPAKIFLISLAPIWTEASSSAEDAMCLPTVNVNGIQYPFDYAIEGPYERALSDFSQIPIENIKMDTIGVGNTPAGDRQLYSIRSPTHRIHSQVPCPLIWHNTPWKSDQEADMRSTIAIQASPNLVTAGMPFSDIPTMQIGNAFTPSVQTSRAGSLLLLAVMIISTSALH